MSKALDKLSKILEQAEHTDNEHERDTFTQAAIAMAAALGIDLAIARAHAADKTLREGPCKMRVQVGNRGSKTNKHMVRLFSTIAHAHDVKIVIWEGDIYVDAYGLPSDIEICQALFGVTTAQMVTDANVQLHDGANKGHYDEDYRWIEGVDGRVWRTNFYLGYRSELQQRLYASNKKAVATAEASDAGTSLVLLEKKKEIAAYYVSETAGDRSIGNSWSGPSSSRSVQSALRRGAVSARNTNLGPGGSATPSPKAIR